MQLFAANDNAPRDNIGTGIGAGKVAIAPGMTHAIDNACCPKRNPGHLNRPHRKTQHTKQGQIDTQHDQDTQQAVLGIQIAFQPVVGGAVTEAFQGFGIGSLFAIELGTAEKYFTQPKNNGRVRITFFFAFGVMLAVDSDLF